MANNTTGATSDYRLKASQLDKIARAIPSYERRQMPPRFALSIGCGLAAGLGTIWAFPQHLAFAWLALAVGGVAYYRFGTAARTWGEYLDNLLSAYEPVNLVAYQRLVDRCLEVKGLDVGALQEWLAVEQAALGQSVTAGRPSSEIPRFVRKHTGDPSRRPPE